MRQTRWSHSFNPQTGVARYILVRYVPGSNRWGPGSTPDMVMVVSLLF